MEPMITISVEDYNNLVEAAKQEQYNLLVILDKLETAYNNENRRDLRGIIQGFSFKDSIKMLRDAFSENDGNLPKAVELWTSSISSAKSKG